MAKWILLFASISIFTAHAWWFYHLNQPKTGPLGEPGALPLYVKLIIISNVMIAVFALFTAIRLFKKEQAR